MHRGSKLPFRWPAGGVWQAALIVLAILTGIAFRFAVYSLSQNSFAFTDFVQAHCVFDCGSYSSVIDRGYDGEIGAFGQPDRSNWAFFPLYPLLASLLTKLLGLSPAFAGFVLSNTLIGMAAFFSRPLFVSNRAYWFFVVTLAMGPFSVLFSSLYTESLFILLTVLSVRALHRSDYLRAGLWVALLSATRITGVLMVFGILAQVVADHRKNGGAWSSLPRRILGDANLLLAFLVAPLGLFAYMAFLYALTGDALAFAHIQRSWGRMLDQPLAAIADAFSGGWVLSYYSLLQQSWALAGILGIALSAVLAVRGRFAEAVFCILCLLASLSSGVGSMVRFTAGLAPLGMIAAELLTTWRWLAWPALALAICLDAIITLGWFNSSMFVM